MTCSGLLAGSSPTRFTTHTVALSEHGVGPPRELADLVDVIQRRAQVLPPRDLAGERLSLPADPFREERRVAVEAQRQIRQRVSGLSDDRERADILLIEELRELGGRRGPAAQTRLDRMGARERLDVGAAACQLFGQMSYPFGPERVADPVAAEGAVVKPFLDIAIPLVTIAMTVVVGLDLSPADFDRVRRQPGTVVAGIAGPLLLLPPIALGLIALFRPAPAAQAGLLLIASCPVGGISNTYNFLARASTALSVTLTAVSCLAAVVTMPLLTRVFELVLGRPFGFQAPVTALVVQLIVLLVVPVGVGMAIRRHAPAFTERYRRAFRLAAFASLVLLIGLVIVAERAAFARDVVSAAPLAAAMVVLSMAAGALVAVVSGASRSDRFTLAVEFGTRNVGIASAIAITVLGRLEFAIFAAIYFVTEAPIVLLAVDRFRKGRSKDDPARLS